MTEVLGQLRDLNQEVRSLREDVDFLKQNGKNQKSDIDRLKHNYHELESKTPLLRNANDTVSFTAYASTTLTYSTGTTILFDGIVKNYGEYYNPNVGVFTCPFTGMYLFHLSLSTGVASTSYIARAEIQVAGTGLVDANVQGYAHGSNVVVTLCNQYQQVSVRSLYSSTRVYGDETLRYSTFTGTLLYLTEE